MFDKARSEPTTNVIGGSIGQIRALKAEVEKEAAVPTYSPEDLGLTPLKKRDKLRQGEKLVVCSGSQIGLEGEVLSTSNRDVEVFLPSVESAMRFGFSQLSRIPAGGVKWPAPAGGTAARGGAKRRGGAGGVSAGGGKPSTPTGARRKPGTSRRVAQYLEDDVGSFTSGGGSDSSKRRTKDPENVYVMR
ncbi:unnamed protein product, partial [Laminaria digitata]